MIVTRNDGFGWQCEVDETDEADMEDREYDAIMTCILQAGYPASIHVEALDDPVLSLENMRSLYAWLGDRIASGEQPRKARKPS